MINELYAAFNESSGVCTDTRKIHENNLFFALKGPSFNGNDFALDALKAGCGYAVCDEPRPEFLKHPRIFLVDDALTALQELARHHRRKLKIPIVALTGSNGKTTTKELMHAVLSQHYRCLATAGNLNNHIGVPLTLLEMSTDHEIAIIEMGANHQQEIDFLCHIAEPDYGLITNIGLAHLEGFGGEEGVYKGKKEMFDYLRDNGGKIFVNADDPKVLRALEDGSGTLYGSHPSALYTGEASLSAEDKLQFTWWRSDIGAKHAIATQLSGIYNFSNALAAVAVGRYFGVPEQKIKRGLEQYIPANQRSQVEQTSRGNTVIVDCYNANPSSMWAALGNLSKAHGEQRIALLGDMMELGAATREEHAKLIAQCDQDGAIDVVVLIGAYFKDAFQSVSGDLRQRQKFQLFDSTEACRSALQISGQSTILLKGSRKMKLETMLELL